MFYELLTGKLPFTATNEAETVFAIINNEPERLVQVRDDVPELVEVVSKKMLEKDPELRYQNCGEVISDLQGIRRQMETSTVSITGTLDRLQTKRKGLFLSPRWIGIAIAFLVVAAGAFVLTSDSGPPPEQVIVAVFDNRTGDSSLDPLCQQISETIAEEIDAIEFLTSMSATRLSVSQLSRIQQGTNPLVRLGRQTDSGTVITGAVYLDGVDKIRIQTDITVLENTDLIAPPDPIIRALAALGCTGELRRLIDQSHAFTGTGTGSPGSSIRIAAIELRAKGHLEEAALLFEEALRWYRNQPFEEQAGLRASIAPTHYWADYRDEARQLYLQMHDENPRDMDFLRALGCLAARDGDVDEAHRYFDELGALQVPAHSQGSVYYDQAAIAASLGEQELAMTLLRRAFQVGYAFDRDLHANLDFDPIRDFPPFQEWIRPKG